MLIFFLLILWTVLAPILAINVVIGINIKKAGIFINPTLNGKLTLRSKPDIKKPVAPNKEIKKPIVVKDR